MSLFLCNFYSTVIILQFLPEKIILYFFLSILNDFKMSHDNIEQVELVENLPPIYLPYQFLHNLHPILVWGKLKYLIFLKPINTIKLYRYLRQKVWHRIMTKICKFTLSEKSINQKKKKKNFLKDESTIGFIWYVQSGQSFQCSLY